MGNRKSQRLISTPTYLALYGRILLEKLIVVKLVKKFNQFLRQHEGSLA
jgi:hypothetical protein